MLSKPIASGMMLTAIVLLGGGALLQSDSTEDSARTAIVTAEPDAAPLPERSATAPGRVVDSAGFPVVPTQTAPETTAAVGPMVTVNGRPLNGERAPAEVKPEPQAIASTPVVPVAPQASEPQVAIAVPPRPEGLVGPGRQDAIDYEAIAAIAYDEDRSLPQPGEFMSIEQRRGLAPLPEPEPYAPYDARREGLVAVVGPNGEPIWIYEEQARGNGTSNSGVTFQTRRAEQNPYGFVYDEYLW